MKPFAPALPTPTLTDSEQAFCALLAEGMPLEDAILESRVGSNGMERHIVSRLLSRPEIQTTVRRLTQDRLQTVGTALSATQLQKLATSAESEAVRLGAAKWLAENAGLGVASRIADRDVSTSARSLSEYSLAELEQLVKQGQETLAQLPKLKVIDATTTGSTTH